LRISVIGLGKLGSPMAACFSARGFTTVGVDLNASYVEAINEGRAPVFEPQLGEMLAEGRSCLTATTDTAEAVAATDATFIIVPTPSVDEGGFSLTYVLSAIEDIGRVLRDKDAYHLVVLTSTVMPGSTGGPVQAALEKASGKRAGVDFGLCYSPEFIALGSVIRDFLNPDFLLIGESDDTAGEMLSDIYRRVVDNDPSIARLNFVNAELAKLSVNTFVTTKIAFANMLARICERLPDASVDEVTSALGLDSRIGAKYLRGAISYGGPCFPRDNIALAALARSLDAPAYVAEATDATNRDGIDQLARLAIDRLPEGGTVGVLGLSYKPNTDVVEESPGLLLARALAEQGVDVVVADPAALPNARLVLGDLVNWAHSTVECVAAADVVVITTAWQEFASLPVDVFADGEQRKTVIDCWRILDQEMLSRIVDYVALGEFDGARLKERAALSTSRAAGDRRTSR
jgi:UDPglucose 6-dehydrogenase